MGLRQNEEGNVRERDNEVLSKEEKEIESVTGNDDVPVRPDDDKVCSEVWENQRRVAGGRGAMKQGDCGQRHPQRYCGHDPRANLS